MMSFWLEFCALVLVFWRPVLKKLVGMRQIILIHSTMVYWVKMWLVVVIKSLVYQVIVVVGPEPISLICGIGIQCQEHYGKHNEYL